MGLRAGVGRKGLPCSCEVCCKVGRRHGRGVVVEWPRVAGGCTDSLPDRVPESAGAEEGGGSGCVSRCTSKHKASKQHVYRDC